MDRRHFARGIGAIVAGSAVAARGQDLGGLVEKMARDTLRKGLEPQAIERSLAANRAGEPHPVPTGDGWTLVAHRYKAAGRPRFAPIVLCHGLTYNALFWDLDPACSPAQYLASAGFDVWSISLRGNGLSQKWVWKLDNAPMQMIGGAMRKLSQGKMAPTGYATLDPKFANWTMDDHIEHDVPAVIQYVRRVTGAPNVTWVGHSMGGIVAIARMAKHRTPGIGKLVAVGSQVTMPNGQIIGQYFDSLINGRRLELAGQVDPIKAIEIGQGGMNDMFFNLRNVDSKVYEALTTWATDVPSIGLMKQYMTLSQRGELLDASGTYSYARNLANVSVPCLFACGASDRFAPPSVQQQLLAGVGSTDKAVAVFGRAQGYQVDAGHDDALVGLNSRAQVYPVLAKWIAQRG